MSFSAILGLLKGIVEIILAIPKWINEWTKSGVDSDAEERSKQIAEGAKEAREATTQEGKASAACKIEKALNSDSECDKDV